MFGREQLRVLRLRLGQYGDGADLIAGLITEIEAQRPVVLAALRCTGEDGHDGVVTLAVRAEEYLDKLCTTDASWRDSRGGVNIDEEIYRCGS